MKNQKKYIIEAQGSMHDKHENKEAFFGMPSAIFMFTIIVQYIPLFKPGYINNIQGGSNMTGNDLFVKKPHCAAAVRP